MCINLFFSPHVPVPKKAIDENLDTVSGKLSLKRSKSQETQKKSESSGQSLPNCCDSFENMFKNDDVISDDVFVTKNEVDGDENND